jgi:hypothetical protein
MGRLTHCAAVHDLRENRSDAYSHAARCVEGAVDMHRGRTPKMAANAITNPVAATISRRTSRAPRRPSGSERLRVNLALARPLRTLYRLISTAR